MKTKQEITIEDYIYCKDCKEFVDLWKYTDLKDTGHKGHRLRGLTEKEFNQCLIDCEECGCFSKIEVTYYGTIRDIEDREDLELANLSQDVIAIKSYLGNDKQLEDFNGFFVKISNGDYEEIYAYSGSVPDLNKGLFKIEMKIEI